MKRFLILLALVLLPGMAIAQNQVQVWDAGGGIDGITSDGDSIYFTLPESHASTALFKAAVTFNVGITTGTSIIADSALFGAGTLTVPDDPLSVQTATAGTDRLVKGYADDGGTVFEIGKNAGDEGFFYAYNGSSQLRAALLSLTDGQVWLYDSSNSLDVVIDAGGVSYIGPGPSAAVRNSAYFGVWQGAGSDSIAVFSNDGNATLDSTAYFDETGSLILKAGSATVASVGLTGPTTGFYLDGSEIGFTRAGVQVGQLAASGIVLRNSKELYITDGTVGSANRASYSRQYIDTGGVNTAFTIDANDAGAGRLDFGVDGDTDTTRAWGTMYVLRDTTQGMPAIGGAGVAQFVNTALTSTEAYVNIISGSAAVAYLAFGDEFSNFQGAVGYNNTSSTMLFYTAGGSKFQIDASNAFLSGVNANAPFMYNVAASSGVVVVGPNRADTNVGLGYAGTDQLELIAGGVVMGTLVEAAQDEFVINQGANDTDFRVESADGDSALVVYGDASASGRNVSIISQDAATFDLLVQDTGTGTGSESRISVINNSGTGQYIMLQKYASTATGITAGVSRTNLSVLEGTPNLLLRAPSSSDDIHFAAGTSGGLFIFNRQHGDTDLMVEPDVVTSGSNTGAGYYDAGAGYLGLSAERANGVPAVTWVDSSAYLAIESGRGALNIMPSSSTVGGASKTTTASLTTTTGTATTIYTLATATDRNYTIQVLYSSSQNDGSNEFYSVEWFAVTNDGGTVTEHTDAAIVTDDNDGGTSVGISGVVSGTNYLIQVTGVTSETWLHRATITINPVAH